MANPDPLDDLTEKEILIQIYRETRTTRRILMWVLVILPSFGCS